MANNYTPAERNRNQRNVLLTTAGVLGVVAISATLQSWSLGAFLAVAAFIGLVAMAFWKSFASQTARPLPADRESSVWPEEDTA